MLVEALIVSTVTSADGQGRQLGGRCMTFGEFVAEWNCDGSKISRLKADFLAPFDRFHPRRKPVLWRVLLAYLFLCRAFLAGDPSLPPQPLSEAERRELDWREDGRGEVELVEEPLVVAERFAGARLAEAASRMKAIAHQTTR
jgi:hypothetical protein